ncbi:MAG: hypothetical protein EBZ91_08310 [Gammaproteobacteria bacterium]|nr:hypothetical protein [Gammaproteobacteria bacterium]
MPLNPRDAFREESARTAYYLRREGWAWASIAQTCGFSGESTARAAAARFARRNSLPPLTTPNANRSAAAAIAAAARWGTSPLIADFSNWTVGVEIEWKGISRQTAARVIGEALGYHVHVYGYHAAESGRGCQLCGSDDSVVEGREYKKWKIEEDASVSAARGRGNPRGFGGEAISPILTVDTLHEIALVTSALTRAGAKVDVDCGLHVHIGVKHLNMGQRGRIVRRWQKNQAALRDFVARSRWNSGYCSPLSEQTADTYAKALETGGSTSGFHKMYALNVKPFSKIGTFEVRLHQGTLHGTKIIEWVYFLLGFFNWAANDNEEFATYVGTALVDKLEEKKVLRAKNGEYMKKRAATLLANSIN